MSKRITKYVVIALAGIALGFGLCYLLMTKGAIPAPNVSSTETVSKSNKTERLPATKRKKKSRINGIDVSHHQGYIDWKKVAVGNDLQFVYIKATEGDFFMDSEYENNSREARKNGLKVGAYLFFRMVSTPSSQFEYFKKVTAMSEMDLIPMIDVELNQNRNGYHIDHYYTNNTKQLRAMRANIKKLVNLFEKEYGCKPMVYCSCNSYHSLIEGNVSDCPIYLGHYAERPGVRGYTIWQYSDNGYINGYSYNIDVCKFAKDKSVADILL
ncbi:MAG: glycoside hydrolase family 25 protein [Bacteroidales bacterium]|nr:glycoside hydrolase family 25 protein [Candidatus Colimorpha onthohippi]